MSIPDNTTIQPGQSFDKVWRLKNTGTCAWSDTTVLNFIGGEQMSAPASVKVPPTAPGATADISATMIAPQTPGQHRNVWQMENQGAVLRKPGDRRDRRPR